jgi:hypothetical protein
MSKKLLRTMFFMFLLCLATGLFSQAILWEDNFDTDLGWTVDGNWMVNTANSYLYLNYSPSTEDYDMSAISPDITLPDNAGDFIISQYVNDYSTDTGEIMEIWIVNGDTEDLIWDWDLDANDSWGVSGGQDLELSLAEYAGETIQIKFRSHGGSTFNFNYWYIYNIKIYGSFDNDLAALGITGNVTPTEGIATTYTVGVRNSGLNDQSAYTVKLMKANEGDDVELLSMAGVTLAQGESHNFEFVWTPDFTGPAVIYGLVDLASDDYPGNNQTTDLAITIQSSGTVVVTVGDPNTTDSQYYAPANFFYKNSLSQTIYMAEEVNMGGLITAIQYKATLNGDIPADRPLKFWMAETTVNEFESNTSWIPYEEFTLVYDGTVNLTSTGDYELLIPLSTPFAYGGGNLVIMCNRPMDTDYYGSANKFYHTITDQYPNRTLYKQSDSAVIDPSTPESGSLNNTVPLTGLFFNTSGMGDLSGTITRPSDNQPVEGVRVQINGTQRAVYSDINGLYEINYIPEGTIALTASKIGYIDTVVEDIVIVADEETNQNISISQLPTVVVSGQVTGTDAPEGLADVQVNIIGYENYETFTDASGNFSFPEVYNNHTYLIKFTKDQYAGTEQELIVVTDNINLGVIELQRVHYAYVGDPESDASGNNLPINFYWKNSITQTIYLENEINMGGLITSLEYYLIMQGDVPADRPIKIWMATTQDTEFASTSGWLPYEDFTLAFEGTIDVTAEGEYPLEIILTEPYVYGGGNLVVMIERALDEEYYSSANHFQHTVTTGNRALVRQSDSEDLDPENPGTGTLVAKIPNTKISFNTEGLGSVSGIVTNETTSAPIAEAKISLAGTSRIIYTDADGAYLLEYVFPGEQTINISKHGFFDNSATFTVTEDENTIANVTLEPRPTVTVSGHIIGNDNPNGLDNCAISLIGYADYEATSNATGDFTIPGVYAGATYVIRIQRESYQVYTNDLVEVGMVDLDLGTIQLNEVTNPPRNVIAEATETVANISWNSPATGAETEFRYDDGTGTGQLGFQGTENSVMGAAHNHSASLNSISWMLTAEGGPHTSIKVWVVGLDDAGLPDRNQVLFEQTGVPNIDGEWNTFELPNPVDAPNGFFIGVSFNGFVGLATDDGLGDDYPFYPNTQFGVYDITDPSYEFTCISGWDFAVNFLIRATGIDNGEVRSFDNSTFTSVVTPKEESAHKSKVANIAPTYSRLRNNIVTNFTTINNSAPRSLTHYSLYRADVNNLSNPNLWEQINGNVTDTTYVDNSWAAVESGEYQYVVYAVYTNDVSSAPAFSNNVSKNMTSEVTVTLTTADGGSVNGAVVKLTNNNGNPNYVYQQTATSQNVVFPQVWKGTYTLKVQHAGYVDYINENFVVQDNVISIPVTLNESNYAVDDDFESYDSFALEFGQWTLVDGDMSTTYGFSGITFPNSGSPMAYMIFTPSETVDPLDYTPHSGLKMAACFAATTPPNNDYMITPAVQVGIGAYIKFWAVSYMPDYGLERFKVLVGTSPNPAEMTVITPGTYVEAPIEWTEYQYSLEDYAGLTVYIGIQCVSNDAFIFFVDDVLVERGESVDTPVVGPKVTKLAGNYPNPFNPTTSIKFEMSKQDHVEIEIYNIKGQKVKTLVNDIKEPGFHEIVWTGNDNNNKKVGSGVYFYKMKTSNYSSTKKMLLIK